MNTGLFVAQRVSAGSVEPSVTEYLQSHVAHEIMGKIQDVLADGRTYQIKYVQPHVMRMYDGSVIWTAKAEVMLTDLSQAEVGDHVCEYAIPNLDRKLQNVRVIHNGTSEMMTFEHMYTGWKRVA